MKLLQLNMWGGRLTAEIVKLVVKEQPDIITAQELFVPDEPVIFPDRMFDCYDSIVDEGSFTYTHVAPTWSVPVSGQHVNFGNVIFSKYPLSNQTVDFVHGHFVQDLEEKARVANIRNVQTVSVDVNGTSFSLLNHQGYWEKTPLGSETSADKMQLVKDIAAGLPSPLIVSGDLNVIADSPAMRVWDGFLDDLTARYNITNTLSRFGKVSDVPCDHILVSPEIRVNEFRVCDELVSDHSALLLDFEV